MPAAISYIESRARLFFSFMEDFGDGRQEAQRNFWQVTQTFRDIWRGDAKLESRRADRTPGYVSIVAANQAEDRDGRRRVAAIHEERVVPHS